LRVNEFKGATPEKRENRHKKREPFALSFTLRGLPLISRRPVVIIENDESSGFSRKIVEIVEK
jgi:hypothetical protein